MNLENPMKRATEMLFAFLVVATVLLAMNGCTTLGQSSVTTRFEETVDDQGVAHTVFEAKSRGEVDASLHKMDYTWGGKENRIQVGQDAAGVTSPAQQALLNGLASLVGNIPGMWDSLMGAVRTPAPAVGTP